MKLYRVHVQDPDEGSCTSWHSSRREADKALRQARKELRGYDPDDTGEPCGVEAIEVPTSRKGLLQWLNSWVTRDNG